MKKSQSKDLSKQASQSQGTVKQALEKEKPAPSPVEMRRGRPPEDMRLLEELQALRAEVQRQRSRCVAPYPFTGRRMHFRDDTGFSLRLLGDGRFQYEQKQLLSAGRQCTTSIEGVLAGAVPGSETNFTTAVFVDADSNLARIELQAMMRSEIEEITRGSRGGCVLRPRKVETVDGRLKLTIGPFFAPEYAEVEPLGHLSTKQGTWPPRLVRLPCVFSDALYGAGPAGGNGQMTLNSSTSPKKSKVTGMCGGTALDWCKTRSKALDSTHCFGTRRGNLQANLDGSPPPRGFRRLGSSASAPQLVSSLPALHGSFGGTSTIHSRVAEAMFRPGPKLRPPQADSAAFKPDFKQVDKGSGPITKFTKQGQFVPTLLLGSASETGSLLGTVDFGASGKTEPVKVEPVAQPQFDWKEYYKNRAATMLGSVSGA